MSNPESDCPSDNRSQKWRWLPRPALSLFMWVLWLLMVNDFSGGHVILGGVLAWLIPYLTQDFWPGSTKLHKPFALARFLMIVLWDIIVRKRASAKGLCSKPFALARFLMIVLWDIIVANCILVVRVLGPTKNLRPAFMELPLDIKENFTITLLASTISLTPGTVSADLSMDGRTLLIHTIYVDDIEAAIADIKQRYEAPLKEIFECSIT